MNTQQEGICAREQCYLHKTNQIRPLGDHGCCYDCEKKISKAVKKPIAKESPKRVVDNRLYRAKAALFLATNTKCQAMLEGCTIKATECHHLHSGKDRAKYLLDETTYKALCSHCHHVAHNVLSMEEAKAMGLKL